MQHRPSSHSSQKGENLFVVYNFIDWTDDIITRPSMWRTGRVLSLKLISGAVNHWKSTSELSAPLTRN